jgi:GxxExxY protein
MEPLRHEGHEAVSVVPEPIDQATELIATAIVDACFRVHSQLGPGLLESVYKICLTHELRKRGFVVQTEVPVPILYDGIRIDAGFKIDLLVNDLVIIEAKAVNDDHPVFKAQLLTHMKLTQKRLGFLVNFNKKLIKDGIHRMAL